MSLVGSLPSESSIRFWTYDDDPEAIRLRVALQNNDFVGVAAFLQSLKASDDREYIIGALSSLPGRPPCYDMWIQAMPACADAWLVRGCHGVSWAWEGRTGARASEVPEDVWPVFRSRLESAHSDLRRSIDLNPNDVCAYASVILCAIGLNLTQAFVFDALNRARRCSPEPVHACLTTLHYLLKKWHGSHDQSFQFAREVSGASRAGSCMHVLIAMVHLERWLYAESFEKDLVFARRYWRQGDVRDEIVRAYYRSVGSPEFQEVRVASLVRNQFAFVLSKVHAFNEAAVLFDQIGDRPAERPWFLYGDGAGRQFVRSRSIARSGAMTVRD